MVSSFFSSPDKQSTAIRAISPGDFQVTGAWPIALLPPKAAGVYQGTSREAFMEDLRAISLAKYYQVLLGNDISRKSSGSVESPGGLEGGHAFLIE
jgi:hypothetical protein